MDPITATNVTIACVQKVGHHQNVTEDQKLSDAGIGTEDRVDALVNVITNDKTVGVPSQGSTIEPNAFHDIDSSSSVGDVSDIVAQKATAEGGDK
jgi:hypothetical protein